MSESSTRAVSSSSGFRGAKPCRALAFCSSFLLECAYVTKSPCAVELLSYPCLEPLSNG